MACEVTNDIDGWQVRLFRRRDDVAPYGCEANDPLWGLGQTAYGVDGLEVLSKIAAKTGIDR